MGVTGLWRLVEPAGKPVPIETLENKVLAVDISIWLHQMVKGYQDAKGAPMANAHLLGLFQRLCKLLYYRIKPVFVFDGAFPELKKETIAKRQDNKAKLNSESERLKREILLLLGKQTAVGSILGLTGRQTSPKKPNKSDSSLDGSDDLFKLPALDSSQEALSSESESDEEYSSSPAVDLHSIDITSDSFRSLPLREKHDLLIELKETRKMNSWGKLHELPKESDNFSDYQMNRLLKRRKVQECLQETEKEIGGDTMTFNELESLLNEEGIDTAIESLPTKRIASNNTTRYLLISNVKQALEDAKKLETNKETARICSDNNNDKGKIELLLEEAATSKHDELDDDLQRAIKMSLECDENAEKQANSENEESIFSSFTLDSDYSDSSEEDPPVLEFASAKAYIMQNSDFTSHAIKDIITSSKLPKTKSKNRVNEIMEELDREVLLNSTDLLMLHNREEKTVELSSSDEECVEVNSPDSDNYFNQAKIIQVVNTTVEDSDVSTEDNGYNTINQNPENHDIEEKDKTHYKGVESIETLNDSSDNDGEFEEVPEVVSIESSLKPGIELNLEIKDSLQDDIFADVFEKESEEVDKEDQINYVKIRELEKDNHSKTVQINKEDPAIIYDTVLNKNISTCSPSIPLSPITELRSEVNIEVEKILHAPNNKKEKVVVTAVTSENNDEVTTSIINNNKDKKAELLTTDQLNLMAQDLQTEREDLMQEKSRLDRMGRNITEQMTRDAQELLQIFGIPYMVAPTEAEAQCAFLESAELTDGTITDDSDIWLFGGKTVYKNFFNQKKHVVQFLSERIERSFNLSREELILLALLVGSDYTAGVSGVGPVTALEILAAFSCSRRDQLHARTAPASPARYAALLTGLNEFKKWLRSGRKTDDTSLRKKLKNVSVADDFPSLRVVQAYMEPKIEKSKEKFTWGEPDVTVLRDYTRKKFGWSQSKLDEILNPVLKRRQEKKNQKSMQDYFKRRIEFQSLEDQMSKRVKAAVEKMANKTDSENTATKMEPPTKIPRRRKANVKKTDGSQPVGDSKEDSCETRVENINLEALPSTSKVINALHVIKPDTPGFDIVVRKLERYQEIIPQREKDRMNVLQNKMKAIEVFRKSQLKKRVTRKRKHILPKEKADLSESSGSE